MQQTSDTGERPQRKLTPRQNAIVELARTSGTVDVDSLAAHFRVTPQTIRRDLNFLCTNDSM